MVKQSMTKLTENSNLLGVCKAEIKVQIHSLMRLTDTILTILLCEYIYIYILDKKSDRMK